jgi:GT2 family glycosyltransferase
MLQDVSLLDEQYTFYSEDYDFFKRLKDSGWQVLFCPQAQVIHHWGASSSQRSQWATSQLYRSKRIYFRKHYGPIAERLLRFGLSIRFTLKILINVIAWPFRPGATLQQIGQQRQLLKEMFGSL